MLSDVTDAVSELAEEALVVDGPGGQGEAVADTLAVHTRACDDPQRRPSVRHERRDRGADGGCAGARRRTGRNHQRTRASRCRRLQAAVRPRQCGAVREASRCGQPGSFGLRDDVDTWDDVERVRERVGEHTHRYLSQLAAREGRRPDRGRRRRAIPAWHRRRRRSRLGHRDRQRRRRPRGARTVRLARPRQRALRARRHCRRGARVG